ncbi:hypothetical protein GCM10011506_43700 [Marivirga lumbricoides]|uniref:Collagen-like protein n=2 Tax=Marivirga lumbricoides TaxID=1046115 RepID=A0ABQ1N479_9BACT|nr:hypothetical protein GCM10011506_43700 [Marivirga lumbricoides]
MLFGYLSLHQIEEAMKNLFHNFQILLLATFLITSCTFNGNDGAPGPRGPQGPPGQDGEEFVAIAYEFPPVSFNENNDYGVTLLYDEVDLPFIFESDKALAFLLSGVDDRGYDIWSPLPQTRFNEVGTYVYNYDFTLVDVFVYLDADFRKGLFIPEETDDKIFRVIIIPARATQRSAEPVDYDNYYAVMEHYGLKESNVKKLQNKPQ